MVSVPSRLFSTWGPLAAKIYVVYAYHVGFSGRERWKVYGVEGLIRRLRGVCSFPPRLRGVYSIPSLSELSSPRYLDLVAPPLSSSFSAPSVCL